MSASDTNLGTPGPRETDEAAQHVQESSNEIAPPEDKGDQPTQRTTDVERSERVHGFASADCENKSEKMIACNEAVPTRAANDNRETTSNSKPTMADLDQHKIRDGIWVVTNFAEEVLGIDPADIMTKFGDRSLLH